jgi:hypothetical protein
MLTNSAGESAMQSMKRVIPRRGILIGAALMMSVSFIPVANAQNGDAEKLMASIAVAAEEKMVADMSKLTCSELTKLGFDDFAGVTRAAITIRASATPLSTFMNLHGATKTVKDYCKTNRRATVMSAAERALGTKMPR